MVNNELIKINFNEIVNYGIDGFENIDEFECTKYCVDCEEKGLVPKDKKLESISHAADSNDFFRLTGEKYSNNTPVMILFENPGANTSYDMGENIFFNNINKYIPIYSYYWIDKNLKKAPKNIDELLDCNNLYGPYLLYLLSKYQLNNVYVTNITKCKLSNNSEYANIRCNCIQKYLEREIEIFKPEIIIFMGNQAHNFFQWDYLDRFHNIKNVTLFHPAARMSHENIVKENDKRLKNIFS